jgi:hypothetical protein
MAQSTPARDLPATVMSAGHRTALLVIVLANYAAQVPYAVDLYGMRVNPSGVVLLLITLAWFVAGVALLGRGSRVGYWLLVSFLAVEFAFYFHGQILGMSHGFGLIYSIVHAHDMVVRIVFLIGDLNFVAAGYFLVHLLLRARRARLTS